LNQNKKKKGKTVLQNLIIIFAVSLVVLLLMSEGKIEVLGDEKKTKEMEADSRFSVSIWYVPLGIFALLVGHTNLGLSLLLFGGVLILEFSLEKRKYRQASNQPSKSK